MFSSSNFIVPFVPSQFYAIYSILNSPKVILDFPLPVLPTIPTFDIGSILNDMFLITKFNQGLYLYDTFSIEYPPKSGQFGDNGLGDSKLNYDGLLSMQSYILTSEFILFYVSAKIFTVYDIIELICMVHKSAKPIIVRFYFESLEDEFKIPKYPAQAIVRMEKP